MNKKKRKNIWIYGLIVLFVLLIIAVVIKNKSKPKGEKVYTAKVERNDILETVSASGKIFPVTEIKISSDVSGEIVELYIEEGDSVTVGQLLAKIDPDTYKSQVERGAASVNSSKAQVENALSQVENLKAQKEQIEAQLIQAREIHERNKKLKADGIISEADFEKSFASLKALEANLRSSEASIKAAGHSAEAAEYNVKSAEAALKEIKTSLNKTSIYSPASGIVSKLNVEKGERVVGTIQMAGTELMRIANLRAMEVQVEVSENDIPRVTIGDNVKIEVDAYLDRDFSGKVVEIAHSASNTGSLAALTTDQVTNFIVTINIDSDSYKNLITPENPFPLRPGMSASVDINTDEVKDVLTVPIQAVTTREPEGEKVIKDDDLLEVVYVISKDTVKMAEVKTGIQDDTNIQILDGVSEDDEIVTGPYAAVSRKLKSGKRVYIEKESEKKDKEK